MGCCNANWLLLVHSMVDERNKLKVVKVNNQDGGKQPSDKFIAIVQDNYTFMEMI